MLEAIHGDRVGKLATLSVICSAVIFDPPKQKVLITRRADNGRWCLPGGRMEPGESVPEACAREVKEESGLDVQVGRLIGVYSNPHWIITYVDGISYQSVVLSLAAKPIGGKLTTSEETTECGYFSRDEMKNIDVMESSLDRIADAFAEVDSAFVR